MITLWNSLVLKVRTLCTNLNRNWKLLVYPTAPVGQQGSVVPGLPAPPQQEAPQQPQDFWGAFKQQMDYDPTQAWRIVNQADPRVMANKLFVME